MTRSPATAAPEMKHPSGGLGRLNHWVYIVFAALAGFSFATYTVLVLIDVLWREVFRLPVLWAGEYALMMFVWGSMTGGAAAAYYKMHFVVDFLPKCGKNIEYYLRFFTCIIAIIFSFVILYYGFWFSLAGLVRVSPLTSIPMIYTYASFPVAGLAFLLFSLEQTLNAIRDFPDPVVQKFTEF